MATIDNKRAYLNRLRAERDKIHVIPVSKRTAWQKSRMKDLARAISIVNIEIKRLGGEKAHTPSPVDNQTKLIKQLYAEFKSVGITGDEALKNATYKYREAYDAYLKNKNFYKQWWKRIYGEDIGDYGFIKNPFAMAAVHTGAYQGFNLVDLSTKANMLSTAATSYEKLGTGATTWETPSSELTFSQLQELGGMYGSKLPTQGEWARLKTDTGFSVDGKYLGDWEKMYEDLRKKRQGLFTGEEAKTTYAQTEEGFAVSGLKPKQKY